MKKGCFVFIALVAGQVQGAFEEVPFSARASALGESLVADSSGVDAFYVNPGALAMAEGMGVLLGHTRLFNDGEWPADSVATVVPTKRGGAWGGSWTDLGSSLYRERELALAWAWRWRDRLGVGAAVKRQDVQMERYGSFGAWQWDAGLVGRPRPNVDVGVSVKNVTQTRLGGVESPPALFSAGVSGGLFPNGKTSVAATQTSNGRSSWRAGQEIHVQKMFALRAGYESNPNRFSCGFGWRRRPVELDYAFSATAALPEQHQFSLTYRK